MENTIYFTGYRKFKDTPLSDITGMLKEYAFNAGWECNIVDSGILLYFPCSTEPLAITQDNGQKFNGKYTVQTDDGEGFEFEKEIFTILWTLNRKILNLTITDEQKKYSKIQKSLLWELNERKDFKKHYFERMDKLLLPMGFNRNKKFYYKALNREIIHVITYDKANAYTWMPLIGSIPLCGYEILTTDKIIWECDQYQNIVPHEDRVNSDANYIFEMRHFAYGYQKSLDLYELFLNKYVFNRFEKMVDYKTYLLYQTSHKSYTAKQVIAAVYFMDEQIVNIDYGLINRNLQEYGNDYYNKLIAHNANMNIEELKKSGFKI